MLSQYRIKLLCLFGSSISSYKISKSTGIPESTLSRIRKDLSAINSMRFDTVEKLIEFYDEGVVNVKDQVNDARQFDYVFKPLLHELNPDENSPLEKDLEAFREFVLTLLSLSLNQINKSTIENKYKNISGYLQATRDILDDTSYLQTLYTKAFALLNSKTFEYTKLRALNEFDAYKPFENYDENIYRVYVQTLTLLNFILEANPYYSMIPALASVVKNPVLHSNHGKCSYTIITADKEGDTHMCTVRADTFAEAELKAVYHIAKDRNLSAFELNIQEIKRFINS